MSFDIDVRIRRGERDIAAHIEGGAGITVLAGPSGVGKTSVLDAIAGLLTPTAGHVRVGGRTLFDANGRIDLPPERRGAGYVFQDARLFPHRRVRANLLYGAADDRRLEAVADTLDISDLLDRWPRALSGGEARRVAIGRALLRNPAFLLLDEPLSSLDPARREGAIAMIERVRDEAKLPILLVTHDVGEAGRLGERIVRLA